MIKTRKFQLGGEYMGHNENEWGKIKNTKKVEVIVA